MPEFVSASFIVQAIMAGLAFASLVTWTIFIAKFIEVFIAKRRLQAAVSAVADARTLGEALSVLSTDHSVMRAFVATAINEVRQSSDLDSETGVKERAASSFSEITRSEARRIRTGTMSINGAMWFAVDTPFGGYRQSGVGRENGELGFEEYLETKVIALPGKKA